MLAPIHHILGLTSIVRERVLPISGNVTVRLQQKVSANDIVAETKWAREHVLLDIARLLNVSPHVAERLVTCKVNDQLQADAEIAKGKGLFAKSIKTPRAGHVVAVGGGQVLMAVGETKIELRAGIPGTIIQILPSKGVVIQTSGGLIQGVWGNGRIASGSLVNLADTPDAVLTPARLDVSLRGSIILAGMIKDIETLEAATELSVRGLIVSSIYPSLLSKAREMNYPILVTDGFGSLPMNSAAYKLLSTNAKRDVTINAEVYDRYTGAKPEVIIPLPTSTDPLTPNETEEFMIGSQIRMRRPPFMGMIGSITTIKHGLTTLPSGLQAQSAEVKLENGETVIAPLVNLEVVG